ncbi:DUF1365 domain-containing protein [Gordonia iterans]|uniref:DUF1365 domain-containing protein n=1 Tax=Gordonia iterans TaxID=1004901 RepID=A0A2S0KHH8_9ACTN|nr:DUF1365 domain-containing protein [Gordonia iterans]AVM01145.1 DUF1365 domain-containing protein [Gordonia iterans]
MSTSRPLLPAIAEVRVAHRRAGPVTHRFSYRSRTWLIDIDDLPQLAAPLRPFARFRAADHFPEPPAVAETLRGRLERHLRGAGVEPVAGPVTALMSPRVAGFVFNPLSVFWCHRPDGTLAYVVAEVHNTYGGRHCYVLDVDQFGRAVVEKEFPVSPFNDLTGHYRLHLPEPREDGRIGLSVVLERPDEEPFLATLAGRALPVTARRVALAQVTTPLAPWVVALRIRIQGIRLWLKRLPILRSPSPERTTTVATEHVTSDQPITRSESQR